MKKKEILNFKLSVFLVFLFIFAIADCNKKEIGVQPKIKLEAKNVTQEDVLAIEKLTKMYVDQIIKEYPPDMKPIDHLYMKDADPGPKSDDLTLYVIDSYEISAIKEFEYVDDKNIKCVEIKFKVIAEDKGDDFKNVSPYIREQTMGVIKEGGEWKVATEYADRLVYKNSKVKRVSY
ncbi:MAG: hypothetical protein L6Q54_13590 [Leptospiraceae bacterium]|nr:hypothetical protein [Leptospiraceae bacterium]MCK6382267.1 hypothetical protein [Leptospiraceae bacterium]NUM41876.1 hypothetical protein [Leptospiraceae bacterium]